MLTKPTIHVTYWTLAAVVAFGAACGGRVVSAGQGQGTGTGSVGRGSGADAEAPDGNAESPDGDAEPPDTGAAAELCTETGGTVFQTLCSANPPFAQFTCASGENGGICDPPFGGTDATTLECVCGVPGSTSQCFDPVLGCVASERGSGAVVGPPDGDAGPPDGDAGPPDGDAEPPDGDAGPPDGDAEPPDGDAEPPDASTAAELCTETGGTVVQTYCSANPPFAQYTCASGENGAVCDPAPGETNPTTPECLCGSPGGTSQCFDPLKGCM